MTKGRTSFLGKRQAPRWTKEEEERLEKLLFEGEETKDIANYLQRTQASIQSKIQEKKKKDKEAPKEDINKKKDKREFLPIKKHNFSSGDMVLVKASKDPMNRDPRCFTYHSTTERGKARIHLFYHTTANYPESFTDVQLSECLRKIIRGNKV